MDIVTEPFPSVSPSKLPDYYEVVDGQVKEMIVGARQVTIAYRLATFLTMFADPLQLGQAIVEMLFHLRDGYPDRKPDVAFISAQRWPFDLEGPQSNAWPVVPELMVEVISPTNTYDEIQIKKREYFEAGVISLWVVTTVLRKIEIYNHDGGYQELYLGDVLKGEPVLPGFELPLRDLFSKRYE